MFNKSDFEIDLKNQIVRCPAGHEAKIQEEKIAKFSQKVCGKCPLRTQCVTLKSEGKRIKIHGNEELYKKLKEQEKTSEGREKLRERVKVEHGLSHVSQRQGNKARYIGTRKNLFDLRMVCSIQNLERTQAFVHSLNMKKAA